ncbi:AraC family transcriptional regulator [uncultured Tenacibaculum sp.]|uniref:helix-turn-helix domain-containing protein n=1 Tax=uncultured Tenacibaculum sp. TaxID=174713 RepID=UPI00262006FB|nr:helix-turn-helix domain-containing protein [uncultured Tenacibaculum sp.]
MNQVSVIAVLGFIIFLLFLFFAGFLLTVKTNKKLNNILLASFLIVTALDISVFFYSMFITPNLNLEMLRIKLSAFKDPLLFLYVLSVIYSNFKLRRIHILHSLFWVFSIVILLSNFFLADTAAKEAFFADFDSQWEIKFLDILGQFVSLGYFLATLYYVLRYRKLILENYTNSDVLKNYNWLKQLLILITIGHVLTLIKGYVRDYVDNDELTQILRIVLLLFGVFFIFWLFLKALNSPKLFRGIDVNLSTSKEIEKEVEEDDTKIQDLKKYMEAEEPYLNPDLTIRKLAEHMKMPMRDLSVLINQKLNQHFFDFINEYRIEKAKKILSDVTKTKVTVLEILYEVGFNSKSSFNTAFKKHTGKTPTQYRKSVV